MPNISSHHSKEAVKMLLIGDSGTGKTAALLGLAKAGYNLRIADFDNGLDILANLARHEPNPEEIMSRIHYISCTDEMKTTQSGEVIPKGEPKAYAKAMRALSAWKDDEADYGPVDKWTQDDVLVFDSMTFLGNAAMRWVLFQAGRVGQPYQGDWYIAQNKIRSLLEMCYSTSIKCNVIFTAHIRYTEIAQETVGYPESVGKALPPQIPRYFNTVAQTKMTGTGTNLKRKIRVVPDSVLPLKNAAPQAFPKQELDLETGLAEIFRAIRGA